MRFDRTRLSDTANIVRLPGEVSVGHIRAEGVRFARGAAYGLGGAILLWTIALAAFVLR